MQGSIIQLLRLNSSMIRLRRCNHLHVIAQASIHAPHGRDILVIAVSRSITVSIHAPTRGATRCSALRHLDTCVSIHAPTRGATRPCPQRGPRGTGFNPRAHTGRDTANPRRLVPLLCFNPRAHTGRDVGAASNNFNQALFQSTRPHGARHDAVVKIREKSVSIHAPTRGATAQGAVALFAGEFQSTRPHGARRLLPFSIVFISMRFNPRAHTGRDLGLAHILVMRWVSIHAPTRGATT